jgi:ATP-dependent Zn protease
MENAPKPDEPQGPIVPKPADPKPIIDGQMIATAYHEAGHAIVALSLGRTIEKCTIVRNSIRLGAVQLGKGRNQRQQDFFEIEAMILLGGIVSEAKHTGQYNWGGAQQDLRSLRRLTLARVNTDQQVERLEKRLLDKTTHHLEQPGHWEAVEAVVAELIRQQAISGRSARHLFDEAMKKNKNV